MGRREGWQSLPWSPAKARPVQRWGHSPPKWCHVCGASSNINDLPTYLAPPPSLPGGAKFLKDYSGCSVVRGGRGQRCRDNRNKDSSEEDIALSHVGGRGGQGQGNRSTDAGKCWELY